VFNLRDDRSLELGKIETPISGEQLWGFEYKIKF